MSKLSCLQDQFQQFIVSGQSGIQDSVIETEHISVDTRLAIYRDAYKLRLIESLNANFPSLYAYLGTEEFNQLCSAYIDANPSPYRSIRWYGDSLADFLKSYYHQHPHLAELAAFEWQMTLAFDAADERVVQLEDMAGVPPEAWANLRFTLHPSVQRINHFWNAIPLWQALTHDQDLPDLHHNPETVAWILWRTPEYIIQFYSLSQEEAWALDALFQNLSFGEICEGLCQWIEPEEVAMCAASYLKGWIQNGILSHLLITD